MKQRDIMILCMFISFTIGLLMGVQWTGPEREDLEEQLTRCEKGRSLCNSNVSQRMAELEGQLDQCAQKTANMAVPAAGVAAVVKSEIEEEAAEGPAAQPGGEAPNGGSGAGS